MAEDRPYTAKDVREVADLSYRQLQDWEQRGALPPRPGGRDGWRRFTGREIFCLLVLSELRRRFGVPVEKLAFVRGCMLAPGADHFRASVELISIFKSPIFLMTDLVETFVVAPETEIVDLMQMGLFTGDGNDAGVILLKLNPLVNKQLGCLKEPIQLGESPPQARGWHFGLDLDRAQTDAEAAILKMLRDRSYRSIQITLNDGAVKMLTTEETTVVTDEAGVAALLRDGDFQTVTATKKNGNVVAVHRTRPRPVARDENDLRFPVHNLVSPREAPDRDKE